MMNLDQASGAAERALDLSLARIKAFDRVIHAFERVDAEGARNAARRNDRTARSGPAGLLSGFVVGVKDVIDTKDMVTSCGSPIFAERLPTSDATVVSLIQAAGGVIVGKTVTTEFAMFDPPPTRNPWELGHTPGGSSAGSAAAVAAGMVRAALGTQTSGSVIRPAAYCGVVGYVPSPGWVSRVGVFINSWSLDRVGLFVRNVDDLVPMIAAVTHYEGRDPISQRVKWEKAPYPEAPRIGVISSLLERATVSAARVVRWTAERLAASGARVRYIDELPLPGVWPAAHATIMRAEVATIHRELFRRHKLRYAPGVAAIIEAGLRTKACDYLHAQRVRAEFRLQLDDLMSSADALLLPAALGPAEHGYASTGDPLMGVPATFGGLPAIALPAKLNRAGLPMGVQLVGGGDRDAMLLALARHVEELVAFQPQVLVDQWAPPS